MNAQAIIVAAGTGTRAGEGIAKQWRPLLGRPVIDWSIAAFLDHPGIAQICIVVAADRLDATAAQYAHPRILVTTGGAERADSVRAGLTALAANSAQIAPLTLVHDAARPGVTPQTISRLLEALTTCEGVATGLPVMDALKRADPEGLRHVDRSGLMRVQTPQAFRTSLLERALAAPGHFVDDLEAAEAVGAHLRLIDGEERLMKITRPEDFDILARLLSPAPAAWRTGQGFDVHAFAPGDHVTLCGVRIPHIARLDGHSDADAGWHALTDAILGAACLGDIGDHFPPTDPRWKDADSGVFLRHAIEIAAQGGWHLAHADITIICEAPRVKPHREAMRARTAELTGLPLDAISVKATTTEGLGFTGRREGIAAMASATLSSVPPSGSEPST